MSERTWKVWRGRKGGGGVEVCGGGLPEKLRGKRGGQNDGDDVIAVTGNCESVWCGIVGAWVRGSSECLGGYRWK